MENFAASFPKKHLGQHFLHDRHVIHQLIAAIAPQRQDAMIEIGPGRGALTLPLLQHLDQLYAIEFDRDLIPLLTQQAGIHLEVIQSNVLRVDFKALAARMQTQKVRVVGNLPYNISTPILFHLLQYKEVIHDMYFMLQKEVVERIVAEPNSKTYGRLSVMIQAFCEANALFTIPPSAFLPPPKVDSMILHLKPYEQVRFDIQNVAQFEQVVRLAFHTRRKMLKNALKNLPELIIPEALFNKRAEELSVLDFVHLANSIS